MLKLHFISLLTSFLVFSLSVKSQNIQSEKKLIIGTWVSTEGDWNFIFENDSICKEYLVKKLEGKYLYKITSADSYCGKLAQVDPKDKIISYLQLFNITTKEITCYEINGVSNKTLSITEYLMSEPALFKRKMVPKPKKIEK